MLHLEKTRNDLTLHYEQKDGCLITSAKTCFKYELLEMKCYEGTATSNMVMVAISIEGIGYVGMLDYIFGADDAETMVDNCLDMVEDFENGDKKPIDVMKEYIIDCEGQLSDQVYTNAKKYLL